MGQVNEPEDDVATVITELQKGEGNDEALSRLFELLEMQKLQQQTLLSRLTKVSAYQENEARKQDIYKFMYDQNMRGLRPALEAMHVALPSLGENGAWPSVGVCLGQGSQFGRLCDASKR